MRICDGTVISPGSYKTNIRRLYHAIPNVDDCELVQLLRYESGLGTHNSPLVLMENLVEGAFEVGTTERTKNLYYFLCKNYRKENEHEIYLFGFSRGAFLVRKLAAMIYHVGLVDLRNHSIDEVFEECSQFTYKENERKGTEFNISLLACFDTVGKLRQGTNIDQYFYDSKVKERCSHSWYRRNEIST